MVLYGSNYNSRSLFISLKFSEVTSVKIVYPGSIGISMPLSALSKILFISFNNAGFVFALAQRKLRYRG